MSSLNERTKSRIALLASDDLDEEEVGEVRQLIASCPQCRRHWVRVRGCLDILGRSGDADEVMEEADLWPEIGSQVRLMHQRVDRDKFNGWVPALSMAAACIAILVAGQMDVTWRQEGNWPAQSEKLAGGNQQSPWMPISQEVVAPTRVKPFFPNQLRQTSFVSEDWGTILVNRERLLSPAIYRHNDPFRNW